MSNLQHLFVPYALALKLKEKGFKEPVLTVYDVKDQQLFTGEDSQDGLGLTFGEVIDNKHTIAAPLYQQVIDWLRIEKDICISMDYSTTSKRDWVAKINKHEINSKEDNLTYPEALHKALEKALELI